MAAQHEEAILADQEKRLTEMLSVSRSATGEAAERLKQAQGLAEEVGRSSVIKDELLQELSKVQGRQRDVAAQLQASEDQLVRLEAASKDLEQRRTQLAFSENRIAAFEARAGELAQLTEEIDARIAALSKKDAIVEAVRNQVANIHDVSARSKADLEYVEVHRSDVATLRERVDEVLSIAAETETRLVSIESRKKLVDEVELKTNIITNMLEDVRLNVETLGEQKAVVDHLMDNFTRLTEKVQEAQTTLRSLQTERELAQRIERGIKTLRKTAAPDEKETGVGAVREPPKSFSLGDSEWRLGASRAAPTLSPEVLERLGQPLFEPDLRLPAEQRAGAGDVGLAHFGVVFRQRPVDDLARRSRHLDDRPRDLLDRHLVRVADVDRVVLVRVRQPEDAVHEIA